MKITNTTLLLGWFAILCVSCNNSVIPISPTGAPENFINWQTAWLDQPVCKLPCWQNITPGVTTRGEAVSILENTPGIVIIYNKPNGLSWNFGSKTEEGDVILSAENGIVSGIFLSSINKDLNLEEIIAVYGFPRYVKPFDCREGNCDTILIYPNLGMLLDVYIGNLGIDDVSPQIEILPGTIVYRVYFIETGMENFQKMSIFQYHGSLMVWKGYGQYP